MKSITILFSITFLITPYAVSAQDSWMPEDILGTESVSGLIFSPDHTMMAWTKRKMIKKKDRYGSDVYLTRLSVLENGKPVTIQMTQGEESNYSPLFSRDGKFLYFLSSREEGNKLWRFNLLGGEPEEIQTFKEGISSISWIDSSTLALVSQDGKTLYETQIEEKKDNVVVVEDSVHWDIDRVYSFDLKTKIQKRLTTNQYPVSNATISQDGRWMITSLIRSRHYGSDQHPDPWYFLHDLSAGTSERILTDHQVNGNFQFTPDHQGFYFTSLRSSDMEWNGSGVRDIYYFDLSGRQVTQVPLDWSNDSEGDFAVAGPGILVSLPNGATNKLAYYRKQGTSWVRQMLDFGSMNDHVDVQALSEDGTKMAYSYSTASKLPEYYLADLLETNGQLLNSKPMEWIRLNDGLRKKGTTQSEVMTWKGYNDDVVDGILYYPRDYQLGRAYPLMVAIHGGPTGVDMDAWRERWSYYPQILAQKGAFILMPNYHGSSNHGLAFIESIKRNYYTPELADITRGIDMLVSEGKVHRDSLGAMGWSNGAILTTMLTVRYPDMFRVACAGAGDVNWTSDFGTCSFGVSFDESYFGGAPWDDVDGKWYNETYIAQSPLFEIEKIRTPTLIFHGSEDRSVPRDQGWEYYRGLQQVGKAPVRFLWFPGQPHGLQKITHQLRKMNEEITWIETYLWGKKSDKNEAFKEGSPLDLALKKQKADQQDGVIGTMLDKTLVPEVVTAFSDSIAIGRFEVTNAQFQAFDSKYQFPASQANFPAVVTISQAKYYLLWLIKLSGKSYRLPVEEEAKALQKKAIAIGAKENTLNYWAGYDITPADMQRLQSKLESYSGTWYKEVGSFPAVKIGKAEIYDLGGNAAEYFGRTGMTYGFDVKDYVDPNEPAVPVKREKAGFRVVLDLK
ncbi:MAG: prolyl oligopeptidase family serine peptidase [Saprospiraceae bacterium]|nr:prolyl oligopeptidase family serine peptidase [Saprospiraceae bacterium]